MKRHHESRKLDNSRYRHSVDAVLRGRVLLHGSGPAGVSGRSRSLRRVVACRGGLLRGRLHPQSAPVADRCRRALREAVYVTGSRALITGDSAPRRLPSRVLRPCAGIITSRIHGGSAWFLREFLEHASTYGSTRSRRRPGGGASRVMPGPVRLRRGRRLCLRVYRSRRIVRAFG